MRRFVLLVIPAALLSAQSVQPRDTSLVARSSVSAHWKGTTVNPVASVGPQNMVFPRIICGTGWSTTLVLVNSGSTAVDFQLAFSGAAGQPSQFSVSPQAAAAALSGSGFQGTLGPNSTLNLALASNATLEEGWGLLSYNGSQGALGGYAIVRHQAIGAAFDFETTIPVSYLRDYSLYVPFDNTVGFQTELTIVNPASNLAAQVGLTYRNPQGQVVLIDSVSLDPGQQMTINLPNEYPDLANQSGTIALDADIDVLSAMVLRYNPAYGTIASVPGIN